MESGFDTYAEGGEPLRRPVGHDDALLRERTLGREEMWSVERGYLEPIRRRAEALAHARPGDAALVRGCVLRQERAAAAWERTLVNATRPLQKA